MFKIVKACSYSSIKDWIINIGLLNLMHFKVTNDFE